ncbi:SCO2322 family protein [Streptomyces sp. NBC_00525]|uniref:SCO2322 family protein n=1 Tax=Streptomyces sp. NBC_00525 TaxID=2903660 RepID=UPI002E820BB3|nr:SCO2322 family protein [Streptomyces sp. NBC_00525]WUC93459.1 SCO2322 family protein [Streptomyces sp. NBC_00525]
MSRLARAVALLVIGAVLAVLGAGTAQAAGYRYWSFWEGSASGWSYATQGPSLVRPEDGSVQGFRFAVSTNSQDATKPRRAPDFAKICADTPAKDGSKRVALVIDPGVAADAPDGETPPALRTACARVAKDASSAEALASVAKPLRYDTNAMLCAISGYPATGCGEQVSGNGDGGSSDGGTDGGASDTAAPDGTASDGSTAPTPAAAGSSSGDGGGPSASVLVGVGAVLLLGIAAVAQARRRRG